MFGLGTTGSNGRIHGPVTDLHHRQFFQINECEAPFAGEFALDVVHEPGVFGTNIHP